MSNKEFRVRHGMVVGNNVLVANVTTNTVTVLGTINATGIQVDGTTIPSGATSNLIFNTANAAFAAANTKFSSSGGTISGAVEITADLTVRGNTRFIDQQTLAVGDPLIYLAANNYTSDIVDIGFVANYVNATSSNVHTGLFRSSGTKEYYLFQGYDKEPAGNYIDPTGNNISMAVLNSTIRTSNLILGGANTINWITSGYGVANAAFGKANTALQNTSGTLAGSLTIAGTLSAITGNTYFYTGPAYYTSARVGPRPAGDNTSSFELECASGVGSKFDVNSSGLVIYPNTATGSYTSSFDKTGNFYNNASVRSPIFYDSDDTGYYLNPNSQSNFNTLSVTYINGTWTSSSSRFGFSSSQSVGSLQNATGSLGGIEIYGGGTTNAAFMAFHRPGAWASYFGVDNDNQFAVGGWSAGADLTYFKCKGIGVGTAASASSGRIYASGELYSTIFYDYNNTGYYADPASTSVFNDLRAPGHVLQVVTALKTDQYYTTAGWENIPGMTASITPKSTSSKILVTIIVNMSKTGGGGDAFVRLLRNGATGIGNGNDGYFGQHAGQDYFGVEAKCIQYLDSPNTTSSTSYVVQINSGGGCYINSRGLNGDFDVSSSISLMEIAQ